jgi:hypothetical protein
MLAQKKINDQAFLIAYSEENIDLGKVKQGDRVTFQYEFKNIGTQDIEIDIVSGCECTTLDWPRDKIKPGESAVINVIFDSTEKEESETVDVDITFKNRDPKTGDQLFKILTYSFDLIK